MLAKENNWITTALSTASAGHVHIPRKKLWQFRAVDVLPEEILNAMDGLPPDGSGIAMVAVMLRCSGIKSVKGQPMTVCGRLTADITADYDLENNGMPSQDWQYTSHIENIIRSKFFVLSKRTERFLHDFGDLPRLRTISPQDLGDLPGLRTISPRDFGVFPDHGRFLHDFFWGEGGGWVGGVGVKSIF